jgi:hypothetical protein
MFTLVAKDSKWDGVVSLILFGVFLADSSSDTDSSADSSATTKPTHKKTAAIKKSAAPPGVRSRVETPPQSKAPSSAVESGPMSESDGEGSKNAVITRKLTRSSSARRSKHLVGKTSDTESESGTYFNLLEKLNIVILNPARISGNILGLHGNPSNISLPAPFFNQFFPHECIGEKC